LFFYTKELKEIEKADKVSKLSRQSVDTLVETINKYPDQIDAIKKGFNEEHPDLNFEDYVKLNTPGKKPVDNRETLKSFEGTPKRVKVDVTKQPTSFISDAQDAIVRRMGPVEDPITGKMITRSEYRKKYGENPK
jgi:hypothetical protein